MRIVPSAVAVAIDRPDDGADKVTGRAIYGSDVRLNGLVHGKILRSPHAHARIKSIDTSAAEKLPGVVAVATAADFPDLKDKMANLGEGAVNLAHLGANVLAHKKVLYKGHAVAAVAATNPHVAEEAAKLIGVDARNSCDQVAMFCEADNPAQIKTAYDLLLTRLSRAHKILAAEIDGLPTAII